MSTACYEVLTPEQAQHFLEKGYVIIEDCLDLELTRKWTHHAYERLGYDPQDASTWEREIVWMDRKNTIPIREISPKAWSALCDVVGGADRLDDRVMQIESGHFTTINSTEWSDAFIVNFRRGADSEWVPPSVEAGGWHKDGSFFRHFLDSREQALLTVLYWSDVAHQGGGTFIAPDSIKHVARFLYERPEGADPGAFGSIIDQCDEFIEITGKVGSFVIMHSFMLHASSNNHSGKPRFMSNPPVVLKEPMQLNRSNPEEFSLLERTTLHALGLDRLDFRPTAPREEYWTVLA